MGKASKKKPLKTTGSTGTELNAAQKAEGLPSDMASPLLRGLLDRRSLQFLLIAVIGLIAYSNSFEVPFVLDDVPSISGNPVIQDINNFLSSTAGYTYNPRRFIGYLSFALNYRWGGLDVTGYHIVNLLIHLLNGILVYFFVILTFKTPYFNGEQLKVKGERSGNSDQQSAISAQFIAFFSALLFVSHPVQTQAVTYIVQRFTSLAALFYLLSVVLYVKGRLATVKSERSEVSSEKAGNSHFTIVWYILSLLSAVLAMRTKEISLTLPVVVVLYEFLFFKGKTRKRTLSVLLTVSALLIVLLLGILSANKSLDEIISNMDRASRVQAEGSRLVYFMTEMRVITTYIRLLVLPVNQNLDYDYPIYRSFFTAPVLLSFLLLSVLFGTAVYLIYKTRSAVSAQQATAGRPGGRAGQPNYLPTQQHDDSRFTIHLSRLIAFGILWFFITLSVESSFIPIADVIFEHRIYLPSAGLIIALTSGALLVFRKFRIKWGGVFVFFSCIVVLLSAATYMRNNIWTSQLELWADTAGKSPGLVRPLYNLGNAYVQAGDLGKAIEMYQKAIQIPPRTHVVSDEYTEVYNNLGCAYGTLGKYDEAIRIFNHVLKDINPDSIDAYNNLGAVYINKLSYREAIEVLEQALMKNRENADARYNLALAYSAVGEKKRALDEYALLKSLSPEKAADLLTKIQ